MSLCLVVLYISLRNQIIVWSHFVLAWRNSFNILSILILQYLRHVDWQQCLYRLFSNHLNFWRIILLHKEFWVNTFSPFNSLNAITLPTDLYHFQKKKKKGQPSILLGLSFTEGGVFPFLLLRSSCCNFEQFVMCLDMDLFLTYL